MAKISLESMEFHAFHGCLEHEKLLGNTFIVHLQFELDTTICSKSDKLDDTLNYQQVYDFIAVEMNIPSQLLEHLAERIATGLQKHFPQMEALKLCISKLNPPLGAKVAAVTIEVEKSKKTAL
jgi:7,8-dihydroneopterin aldolase/epimerase/oxygenase